MYFEKEQPRNEKKMRPSKPPPSGKRKPLDAYQNTVDAAQKASGTFTIDEAMAAHYGTPDWRKTHEEQLGLARRLAASVTQAAEIAIMAALHKPKPLDKNNDD